MNILGVTLFVLLSALLPLSSASNLISEKPWNYNQNWSVYEDCIKPGQSPIALSSETAVKDDAKINVEFYWNKTEKRSEFDFVLKTFQMGFYGNIEGDEATSLDGVKYKFSELTFRWGSDASKGSEHSVDGKFFSGEIQMSQVVFIDELIISVLLEEDADLGQDTTVFRVFADIFDGIQKGNLIKAGIKLDMSDPSFSLSDLLPTDRHFFRYTGSNTFPYCRLPKEWIVFKTPLKVTSRFFAVLRSLTDGDGAYQSNNFRDIQELGDRTVYKSFD